MADDLDIGDVAKIGVKAAAGDYVGAAMDAAPALKSLIEEGGSGGGKKDKSKEYRDAVDDYYGLGWKNALYDALDAVSTGSKALGKYKKNEANRLATALLAASRQSSQRDRELFGTTASDVAGQLLANDQQRRGENWDIWTDAISDAIDKISTRHETEDREKHRRYMVPYDKEQDMSGMYWQSQQKPGKIDNIGDNKEKD